MIYMVSGLIIGCSTALIAIRYVIKLKAQRDLETAVRARHNYEDRVDPFEASAYLDRLENVYLSIQETAQPVDWTITLWLGLDGLRIDPDGTTEWIKRSAPAPQHGGGGGAGVWWEPDILALSGPLPPYRLPTPPPPQEVHVLYADGRAVEMDVAVDPTMSMQAQLDKLRTENAIMASSSRSSRPT